MTRIRAVCLLLALACPSFACSKDEPAPGQWSGSKDELAGAPKELPGAATYRRYCIACHSADGRGNGGITGKDFVGEKLALAAKSDTELAHSIREGKRGVRAVMPAHKPVLSDAQISEVVGYVRQHFLTEIANRP